MGLDKGVRKKHEACYVAEPPMYKEFLYKEFLYKEFLYKEFLYKEFLYM